MTGAGPRRWRRPRPEQDDDTASGSGAASSSASVSSSAPPSAADDGSGRHTGARGRRPHSVRDFRSITPRAERKRQQHQHQQHQHQQHQQHQQAQQAQQAHVMSQWASYPSPPPHGSTPPTAYRPLGNYASGWGWHMPMGMQSQHAQHAHAQMPASTAAAPPYYQHSHPGMSYPSSALPHGPQVCTACGRGGAPPVPSVVELADELERRWSRREFRQHGDAPPGAADGSIPRRDHGAWDWGQRYYQAHQYAHPYAHRANPHTHPHPHPHPMLIRMVLVRWSQVVPTWCPPRPVTGQRCRVWACHHTTLVVATHPTRTKPGGGNGVGMLIETAAAAAAAAAAGSQQPCVMEWVLKRTRPQRGVCTAQRALPATRQAAVVAAVRAARDIASGGVQRGIRGIRGIQGIQGGHQRLRLGGRLPLRTLAPEAWEAEILRTTRGWRPLLTPFILGPCPRCPVDLISTTTDLLVPLASGRVHIQAAEWKRKRNRQQPPNLDGPALSMVARWATVLRAACLCRLPLVVLLLLLLLLLCNRVTVHHHHHHRHKNKNKNNNNNSLPPLERRALSGGRISSASCSGSSIFSVCNRTAAHLVLKCQSMSLLLPRRTWPGRWPQQLLQQQQKQERRWQHMAIRAGEMESNIVHTTRVHSEKIRQEARGASHGGTHQGSYVITCTFGRALK